MWYTVYVLTDYTLPDPTNNDNVFQLIMRQNILHHFVSEEYDKLHLQKFTRNTSRPTSQLIFKIVRTLTYQYMSDRVDTVIHTLIGNRDNNEVRYVVYLQTNITQSSTVPLYTDRNRIMLKVPPTLTEGRLQGIPRGLPLIPTFDFHDDIIQSQLQHTLNIMTDVYYPSSISIQPPSNYYYSSLSLVGRQSDYYPYSVSIRPQSNYYTVLGPDAQYMTIQKISDDIIRIIDSPYIIAANSIRQYDWVWYSNRENDPLLIPNVGDGNDDVVHYPDAHYLENTVIGDNNNLVLYREKWWNVTRVDNGNVTLRHSDKRVTTDDNMVIHRRQFDDAILNLLNDYQNTMNTGGERITDYSIKTLIPEVGRKYNQLLDQLTYLISVFAYIDYSLALYLLNVSRTNRPLIGDIRTSVDIEVRR